MLYDLPSQPTSQARLPHWLRTYSLTLLKLWSVWSGIFFCVF